MANVLGVRVSQMVVEVMVTNNPYKYILLPLPLVIPLPDPGYSGCKLRPKKPEFQTKHC